jgi:hypothetical protein
LICYFDERLPGPWAVGPPDSVQDLESWCFRERENKSKGIIRIQKLKAKTCPNPRDAAILVVSQSRSGRQFLRDWKDDKDKTIVYASWITESQRLGYLLGAQESSKFIAIDDGRPLSTIADDEDEAE